ncbi:recombinase family protein [Paraburkholderia sp. RL18-103-BIB-C]|uniref:recombinase family protein n=1 Tax=Paraburkholderia sp. RL18-103-BIB-C TaxID=3031637 RepID=UPI0038BCDB62
MATYGYVRVSTIEQGNGTSPADQERKIRGIAMMHGAEHVEMFADIGVSGSSEIDQRPEGAKLVAKLQKGDVLIVAKLDRAFRDACDAQVRLKAWKKAGIDLILGEFPNEPVTTNGISKTFFGILAEFAELERTRILERTNDGRKAKRAAGGYGGGLVPFGHSVDGHGKEAKLVADPKAIAARATIVECRAAGMSLRATAELAAQKHGVAVSYETVRKIEREANPA